jgi:hypothetical protein
MPCHDTLESLIRNYLPSPCWRPDRGTVVINQDTYALDVMVVNTLDAGLQTHRLASTHKAPLVLQPPVSIWWDYSALLCLLHFPLQYRLNLL